ncbi:glycosyltransferase [Fodinicola feengrottensis]|uniref:glycosyltransferase n=1 Tax=Fodinicola feengrottensis TaxID=435914 RepID=UPI0013CF4241|nr:glycosyltransferase [Fodinicola feengrottensis]
MLITGGRAPVALDLARKFARRGARVVVVAESVSAQLCGRSRAVARTHRVPPPRQRPAAFVAALADIVRREEIDLIVPTCEEIFAVSRGLDALPCEVLAAPLQVLRRLHSKWEFIEAARALGLPVPATWLITSPRDLAGHSAAVRAQASLFSASAPKSGQCAIRRPQCTSARNSRGWRRNS